jgi:hypothetical protein
MKDFERVPATAEDDAKKLHLWKDVTRNYGFPTGLSLDFRVPDRPGVASGRIATVNYLLRGFHRRGLVDGRMAETPALGREPQSWAVVSCNCKHIDFTDSLDAQWCLTRFPPPIAIFEPDFAFGDTDVNIVKNIGDNPRAKVWPILVYGPEKVKEIGRERLLEAPAFRVDELDYGGVWLQVAENPFVANRTDLRKLAEYLNLEMPD